MRSYSRQLISFIEGNEIKNLHVDVSQDQLTIESDILNFDLIAIGSALALCFTWFYIEEENIRYVFLILCIVFSYFFVYKTRFTNRITFTIDSIEIKRKLGVKKYTVSVNDIKMVKMRARLTSPRYRNYEAIFVCKDETEIEVINFDSCYYAESFVTILNNMIKQIKRA